jgi:hypothetical protein
MMYEPQSKSSLNFFDIDRLLHNGFVLPGQRVTGQFYLPLLQGLRDAFLWKQRDKWQGQWFLHHDNAPSHTLLVVQQFFVVENIPVITQPPHFPNVAPSEFWLFFTLKMGLKGTHFAIMEGIKPNATAEFGKILKEAFRRCVQQWQDRWSHCVRVRYDPTLKVIR